MQRASLQSLGSKQFQAGAQWPRTCACHGAQGRIVAKLAGGGRTPHPQKPAQADPLAKLRLLATSVALSSQLGLLPADAGVFPDCGYSPPSDWTGPVFQLSQDYPTQVPLASYPWQAIDYKTQPREYLKAVLDYSFEGNIDPNSIEKSFVVQNNRVRKWFHAPWMHTGPNAREFVHGLTNERQSVEFELSSAQDQKYRNSAVGFYNEPGGYAIGRVWADPKNPDPKQASFPEGSVAFKLLFTQAPVEQIAFLKGAPEWTADANRNPKKPSTSAQVEATKVRLLQIDIAVKDRRADPAGGWVFGTFQYDDAVQDASPWRRVTPVALSWGNDPTLTASQYQVGGARSTQSWVNQVDAPVVLYRASLPPWQPSGPDTNKPRVLGWAGRANGPVDNASSSCLACHGTAQIPMAADIVAGGDASDAQRLQWFRNLQVGQAFTPGSQSLDFSLQLGVGIQNFMASTPPPTAPALSDTNPQLRALGVRSPTPGPNRSFAGQLLKDNVE